MQNSTKQILLKLQTLPKYQLERRIDIFVLEKLNAVFKNYFDKPAFIYPEFPLQSLVYKELNSIPKNLKINEDFTRIVGALKQRDTNHNTNVDYLLASKDTFYLVEFKTDSESFKHVSQLLYYAYYMKKTFSELYGFFRYKLAVDKQDPKWNNGLKELDKNLQTILKTNLKIEDYLNENKTKLKLIYLGPSYITELPEYIHFKDYFKGDSFEFVSLIDFADKIDDDPELKDLLVKIDAEDRKKQEKKKNSQKKKRELHS